MKIRIGTIAALGAMLLLLAGCEFGLEPENPPFAADELAEGLNEYRPHIGEIAAASALATSPEPETIGGSAVAPPWKSDQAGTPWAEVFLTDPNDVSSGKTPEELFTEYRDGTSEVAYVPGENEFISDYYGPGDELRFVLTRNPGNIYEVEVYVYPRLDFNIAYTYERYWVGSSAWSNYESAKLTTVGYEALQTHYVDGSVGDRTVIDEYTFDPTDGAENKFYPAFSADSMITTLTGTLSSTSDSTSDISGTVPLFDGVTDGISDYVYPDSVTAELPEPSTSVDGEFSSHIEETYNGRQGSKMDSVQLYTELADGSASGVTYASYGRRGRWATTTDSVSRSRRYNDGDSRVLETRSLTTTGNSGSIWFSDITETTITTAEGEPTTYESVVAYWWGDITSNSELPPYLQSTVTLTETSAGSGEYTGYNVSGWGPTANQIQEIRLAKGDGRITVTSSRWDADISTSSLSGSAVGDQISFTIATDSDGFMQPMELTHDGGTLRLSYEAGALIGTYTKDGYTEDVMISGDGVGVGNRFYRGSEFDR